MFANLKNKIFEEVKASPQKFQQFAQAAQAAVSSTSSTASDSVSGSDNFFSITEEDTPQNSPHKISSVSTKISTPVKIPVTPNATPSISTNNGVVTFSRTRKLSNSSVASDVSFRLPSYDTPAVYHLQSDLDISASEVEDSVGPSTAHLDLISKEQLHNAYKKALERYQKYRSRYTDLAKRYRDLERDSSKARAVLVETQDKAIRRISELREQCSLEQQAKAHLEEALRLEMDDMQCKIKAYQTKLKLIGENPEQISQIQKFKIQNEESLIQSESQDSNLISLDGEAAGASGDKNVEMLNEKISQLEELLGQFRQKVENETSHLSNKTKEIDDLNQKLQESEKTIAELKKREEENVILLAQNKLMIHSELENKEKEVKKLTGKITTLEGSIQETEMEKNHLRKQVSDLNELQTKLKQITALKQDFEAKFIANEHILNEIKQELKEKQKIYEDSTLSLQLDYDEKINKLKTDNNELNEMLKQSTKSEVELAEIDNELNRTKTENNSLKETVEAMRNKGTEYRNEIEELINAVNIKQEGEKRIKIEKDDLLSKMKSIEDELETLKKSKEANELEIKRLQIEIENVKMVNESTESEAIASLQQSIKDTNLTFNQNLTEIKNQLSQKENQLKHKQVTIDELTQNFNKTQSILDSKTAEESSLQDQINHLQEKLEKSKHKIEDILREKSESEQVMEKEKIELKSQVVNILQEIGRMEEQMKEVRKSHSELEEEKRNLEKKIEKMTKQNQENYKWQTLHKESEEKLRQLETKLQSVESENSQIAEKNCLLEENSNRLEILLKEKENSLKTDLHKIIQESENNLSALRIEHETANETIKKLNDKMSQVLDENSRLHNAKEIMEHEFRSLQDQCEDREKEKLCVLDSNKCLEDELKKIRSESDHLKRENSNLNEMYNHIREDFTVLNAEKTAENEKMQKALTDVEEIEVARRILEQELNDIKNQIINNPEQKEEVEKLKAENKTLKIEIEKLTRMCEGLKKELEDGKNESVLKIQQNEKLLESVKTLEITAKELQDQLATTTEESNIIRKQNEVFKKEIDSVNNNNQTRLAELENLLKRTNDEKQTLKESIKNATDMEKKLQNYEELKIENEYLNTMANQLERNQRKLVEEKNLLEEEVVEIREKMKSQQCELYVYSENKDKHEEELKSLREKVEASHSETESLRSTLEDERAELQRQNEHSEYITLQNDNIQKELLLYQQKLLEAEKLCGDTRQNYEDVLLENDQLKKDTESVRIETIAELERLKSDVDSSKQIVNDLTKELIQATKRLDKLKDVEIEKKQLEQKITELNVDLSEKVAVKQDQSLEAIKSYQADIENLRKMNQELQNELEDLKHKSSAQISNLTQEIDDMSANSRHQSEKLLDYERLLEQNNHLSSELSTLRKQQNESANGNNNLLDVDYVKKERDDLEMKLNKIMHEVQDVSNRNLFLEQKCENYLILEQSNERLKLSNEKLARQLDETLVSLQHSEGISANTEFEYLRNIMFQYLTGNVTGNNSTLVKVIAAVLKFSPQQTQVVIEKEHQRHTVIGQLNNLL